MEIKISEKLKKLRRERGITQEDLGQFLGISPQSVSKWERDEGYPDITLLPRIAGYYHVSVDELLGVDEYAKGVKIKEITDEYNKIRRHMPIDKDHGIDEGIELIRNALTELPGVFFFEQLLASDLSWKGRTASDNEKVELYKEAISLCEDILSRCTEQRWRNCANEILVVIYSDLNMKDEALELAYQMQGPFTTCEYMLTYILDGDELINRHKINAVLYYSIFRESVLKLKESGVTASDIPNLSELGVRGIDPDEYIMAIENIGK